MEKILYSVCDNKTTITILDEEISEMLSEAYLAFGDEACEMLSNVLGNTLENILQVRDEILHERGCE